MKTTVVPFLAMATTTALAAAAVKNRVVSLIHIFVQNGPAGYKKSPSGMYVYSCLGYKCIKKKNIND